MKLSSLSTSKTLAVASLLALEACTSPEHFTPFNQAQATAGSIESVIDEAPTRAMRLQAYMSAHPEVAADLQAGLNYFLQAENAANATGNNQRTAAQFETFLTQLNASLRIPNSADVIHQLQTQQPAVLTDFEQRLAVGQNALYLDGHHRHLFVIQRTNDGFNAIREVDVTTGAAGFSNVNNSGGTPLGAQTIQSLRLGQLGEVVSHTSDHGCDVGNLLDTVQKGQGGPACITSIYAPINYGRGIGFHGTNYELDREGNLYMNRAASGGCIRLLNADIAALLPYFYDGMPVHIVGSGQRNTTIAPTQVSPPKEVLPIETIVRPELVSPEIIRDTVPAEGTNF